MTLSISDSLNEIRNGAGSVKEAWLDGVSYSLGNDALYIAAEDLASFYGDSVVIDPGAGTASVLSISDEITIAWGILAEAFDDLRNYNDTLNVGYSQNGLAADQLSLADTVSFTLFTAANLSEQLNLSDAIVAAVTILPNFADTLIIIDNAQTALGTIISLSDALTFSDLFINGALSTQFNVTAADQLSMSDNFDTLSNNNLRDYLRRYLNDVV